MISTRLSRSTVSLACLGSLCLLAGCDLFNIPENIKNPVAPPPPKRLLEDAENLKTKPKHPGFAKLGQSERAEKTSHNSDDLPDFDVRTADASKAQSAKPATKVASKAGHAKIGTSEKAGWKRAGNQSEGVEHASFEEPALPLDPKPQADNEPLVETQVAATVNGVPILVSELLEPYSSYLTNVVAKQRPYALAEERRAIIEKVLDTYIERQLLINALRTKLKEEQLESVETQLQKSFDEEVKKMYKQYKVATLTELDVELGKQNTSLDAVKQTFRNNRLAQQWMLYQTAPKAHMGRGELLAYYQAHLADYTTPARLKWQQISISSAKHGSEAKALAAAKQILDELEAGKDFDELAKKHSAGATARDGGKWDWMRQDSFADQGLAKLLFELPVKDITGPYRTADGFDIVRVTERQESTRKSFESMQEEIRKKIAESQFKAASAKLLNDLRENATIEIVYNKNDQVREARKAVN